MVENFDLTFGGVEYSTDIDCWGLGGGGAINS